MKKPENIEYSDFTLISDDDKKARGLDMGAFGRRMQMRLRKVRGEESETDTFLVRHNFYEHSHN